jgi:hypothetical protein
MGQWAHPGKNTMITGNASGTDIVNYNDPYNLLAVSNIGEIQYIPANDPGPFHFKGSSVVEYPIKHQYGGLLGESRFTDYAGKARLGLAKTGISPYIGFDTKQHIGNILVPAIQGLYQRNPYNAQYLPDSVIGYATAINPKADQSTPYTYIDRVYGGSMDDKKAFVEKSFDDWYYTFKKNGHSSDDSIRMAKFFALQDAFESQYGAQKAFDTHNYGGMNDVAEAKRQGKHFVHKRYNTA